MMKYVIIQIALPNLRKQKSPGRIEKKTPGNEKKIRKQFLLS